MQRPRRGSVWVSTFWDRDPGLTKVVTSSDEKDVRYGWATGTGGGSMPLATFLAQHEPEGDEDIETEEEVEAA